MDPAAVLASLRSAPHALLDVPPHRVAYRRFGQGPDLVFVHGWPLTQATFRALVPRLAGRFTCHLVDLAGSGQTESPDGAPDFVSQAALVRGVADRLGLTRYGLVAHDSGGLVARLVAAEDPRVAAVVSGNTEIPGHTPESVQNLIGVARSPGGPEGLRQAMQSRDVRRSDAAYGGCFADLDLLDGDFHELLVAPILGSERAWARQLEILGTLDASLHERLAAAHAEITAPVLFVWGDLDPFFPIGLARGMVPTLRDARLEGVPGGKCFVHEEFPAAFAELAGPFLAEAFGGPFRGC